ncbi:unnamed protein product [Didymodactylos carnosus]|uniref:Uncharacterized protein n=1 Tax=Didymodactylos carnosus TaxID=1234261 RepID=A0A813TJA8_9BILA|nr:unnamed protein product [Didymodactylos carnosus]CAF0809028.1 unnamed protein product [Didymodactylos carnosus]CAF3586961.1 unnamed protein product [Didymodactylos carnosus]CAF3594581.1 unnamed protein product [Didymodactylos carnosus]
MLCTIFLFNLLSLIFAVPLKTTELKITVEPHIGFLNHLYPASVLNATQGTLPYQWSGSLPDGFNLTPRGVLTGFAKAAGTHSLTVTDSTGASASTSLTIVDSSTSSTSYKLTISSVSLNGIVTQQIVTTTNSKIQFKANYQIVAADWCPGCMEQIQIGFSFGLPQGCIYSGGPGLAGATGTGAMELTAPPTPGRYYIAFDRSQDMQCRHTHQNWWHGMPSPANIIAAVDVIDAPDVKLNNGVQVSNVQINSVPVHHNTMPSGTYTVEFTYSVVSTPDRTQQLQVGLSSDDQPLDSCIYSAINPGTGFSKLSFKAPQLRSRYYLSIQTSMELECVANWVCKKCSADQKPGNNFHQIIGVIDVN